MRNICILTRGSFDTYFKLAYGQIDKVLESTWSRRLVYHFPFDISLYLEEFCKKYQKTKKLEKLNYRSEYEHQKLVFYNENYEFTNVDLSQRGLWTINASRHVTTITDSTLKQFRRTFPSIINKKIRDQT